jgi:hypothetical protein
MIDPRYHALKLTAKLMLYGALIFAAVVAFSAGKIVLDNLEAGATFLEEVSRG